MAARQKRPSAHNDLPVLNTGRDVFFYLRDLFDLQQKRRSPDDNAPVRAVSLRFYSESGGDKEPKNNKLALIAAGMALIFSRQSGVGLSQALTTTAERVCRTPALRAEIDAVLDSISDAPKRDQRWPDDALTGKRRPLNVKNLTDSPLSIAVSRTVYDRALPLTKQRMVYDGPAKTFNQLAKDWHNIRQFNLGALTFELDFAKAVRRDDSKALKKLSLKNNFYYASVQASYIDKGLMQFQISPEKGTRLALTETFNGVDDYIQALGTYIDQKLKPWTAHRKKRDGVHM